MSGPVALAGWLTAAGALGTAAACRRQLWRRRELVARACHELRGPLTSARLGLALLGRAGEGVAARVVAIDLELRRAGLALEDLYAARAGQRGRDREEEVVIGPLVSDVASAWRGFASACGARLIVDGAGCPAVVRGDRLRLAQACGNVLANAIEHGGGAVRLAVSADRGRVRVEVSDQGPGLPVPVAELAGRPHAGRGRRGRGLAIASEIALRHGGRLAAAPSGGGARVALELPLAPAAGVAPA